MLNFLKLNVYFKIKVKTDRNKVSFIQWNYFFSAGKLYGNAYLMQQDLVPAHIAKITILALIREMWEGSDLGMQSS